MTTSRWVSYVADAPTTLMPVQKVTVFSPDGSLLAVGGTHDVSATRTKGQSCVDLVIAFYLELPFSHSGCITHTPGQGRDL